LINELEFAVAEPCLNLFEWRSREIIFPVDLNKDYASAKPRLRCINESRRKTHVLSVNAFSGNGTFLVEFSY